MTYKIDIGEHLTSKEFHQVMRTIGDALNRSHERGLIQGDVSTFGFSIKAYIEEEN